MTHLEVKTMNLKTCNITLIKIYLYLILYSKKFLRTIKMLNEKKLF